ncbi:MAG: WG repeat-containing protein [Cyclobacteriaceae bacterium]
MRQAEKKITQHNWAGARQLLRKVLRKDTLNVEAQLLQSRWFFERSNPALQIDSAYAYNQMAMRSLRIIPLKQKEKLNHDQIDSALIVFLRTRIDSAAFGRAKLSNTEKAYNDFLEHYLFSSSRNEAIELRDETAYLDALKQNTYQTFEKYFKKYPNSHRAKEARQRYEKLLFDSHTQDKKLNSYLSFVKDFPHSPFAREAEKNIFELLTISGKPQDLEKFILDFPQNSYTDFARSILFHLLRELEEQIPEILKTDSLKKVIELNRSLWAPVYKNGKYGFINSHGVETLTPQFLIINENYKCGSINDDILVTDVGLISRSGRVLTKGSLIKDLGFGFLKINDSLCTKLLHKSGESVLNECLQDAAVLGGQFLTIKKNNSVGICALNGRWLLSPQWHSIEMVEGVIVLDRKGKKTLCTPEQISSLVNGNSLPENFIFDEVKVVGIGRLLVRNGALEGIVNSKLQFVVPLAMQSLVATPLGTVRKLNEQFIFSDEPELKSKKWDQFYFHGQWLRLKNELGEQLYDIYTKKIVEPEPDSLWFQNRLAFAKQGDSLRIHINSSSIVNLPKGSKMNFIKSPDSVRFFFTEQKNKKSIFNIESGKRNFTTDVDKIESLNSSLFVVTKKNKKGILNLIGKTVLNIEYDAFVLNGNLLSTYKEKKFGMMDLLSRKTMKPSYEKNLLPLNDTILIAYKDGHYGLINWQGENLTPFEFDEIQPWSENRIWAKRGFEWILYDFENNRKVINHIRSYSLIKDQPEEKIAVVKQDNVFGVVSSTKGVIIPPNFSNVYNLGNEEEPFYFTSKEVEEAGITVVIYYDKDGKLLRKQVYEDEEFAKILCPED